MGDGDGPAMGPRRGEGLRNDIGTNWRPFWNECLLFNPAGGFRRAHRAVPIDD